MTTRPVHRDDDIGKGCPVALLMLPVDVVRAIWRTWRKRR